MKSCYRTACAGLWLLVQSIPARATADPARQLAPQPVAEFSPTEAVFLSADLFAADYHGAELVQAIAEAGATPWLVTPEPQIRAALAATLKAAQLPATFIEQTQSLFVPHGNIWMRDYGPVLGRRSDGGLQFFDFIYADATSKLNDAFPARLGKRLGIPVENAGLELDGGNFLTDGDFCFTSDPDLTKTKEVSPQRAFARLGCRRLLILGSPPHPHLDMWTKIVGRGQILVNTVDERTLAVARRIYGHVPPELLSLRETLDQKAAELSQYMSVHRLPMPLPYRGAFRTYANAILINGQAIVPTYRRYGWNYDDYPDSELKAYYEDQARLAYAASGYRTRFINADGLIYNGGAFHCVTVALPPKTPRSPETQKQHHDTPANPVRKGP